MPVTDLLDLELAVPDPEALATFWERRGMRRAADGVLGTADRPSQLRISEGPYRHVREVRLVVEYEHDLDDIERRLDKLGIVATVADGRLRCADPVNDHDVVIEVGRTAPITSPPPPASNRPGARTRLDRRAPACLGEAAHAPRRVGHVVFGTPDVDASMAFYVDGLGFRISDVVGNGVAYFLRCSADHHNLLLSPAPVPCLNHYAVEVDDVDAIGLAGMQVLAEQPESSVAGIGRHVVGANLFWYLLDPAGGMFELFADMDQIVDDEQWEREVRRDDWDPFGVGAWMPAAPAPDFWLPVDLDDIARAREAAGR